MSATTALGAAPLLAAEEAAADVAVVERQEEQKVAEDAEKQRPQSGEEVRSHAERGNESAAEVDAEDTAEVSEEDTVVAAEAPQSGEDGRSHAERGNEVRDEVRQAAADRVRHAAGLPPGLRERLAAVVESGGQVDPSGQSVVSIDEAIRAVAESLPTAARLQAGDVNRPEHPSGESFFTARGEGEISDQQAEEIARGQLARSGLLRGQRVRVAQD